jgi:phage repressor protein C with HTH and peptisase S24 domain
MGITQAEFARRIGIHQGNLSKYLKGTLPITDGLINRVALDCGVSRRWLTSGTDLPFAKPEPLQEYPAEVGTATTRPVPVFDIDVTAGYGLLAPIFEQERPVGYIDLPKLRLSDDVRIVRVSGNSMSPTILDGGLIAVRQIKSGEIFWGQIYVVVLDDYRMVKMLRPHPTDSTKVILHSVNPQYDDMEVYRRRLLGMYLVEAVINYSQLC